MENNFLKNWKPWNYWIKTWIKPISVFKKWIIPWNKWLKWSYKLSDETIKKMSESAKWKNTWSKWRKQSDETINKKRLLVWEKAWWWKWWLDKLTWLIRRNYLYRQWRNDVFTRDDFTCCNCLNNKKWKLNAHHIVFLHYLISKNNIETIEDAINCDELWNINNWITLCKECHTELHNKIWRKYEQMWDAQQIEATSYYWYDNFGD